MKPNQITNSTTVFFICLDTPFYRVRAQSLESYYAKNIGICCSAIFLKGNICPQSVIVFNRFSTINYFFWIYKQCQTLKIPYVFDIDDIFWDLPLSSTDTANNDPVYLQKCLELANNAALITTTNENLKNEIQKKFLKKEVYIIPNALSPHAAPKNSSLVIANTDNFKLSDTDTDWFVKGLLELTSIGVAVQIIGENNKLLSKCNQHSFFTLERLSYNEYLKFLVTNNFKWGLIPVEDSLYSICKSDIKVQEFIGAEIKTYASKIKPYVNFKNQYPMCDLVLVENDQASWQNVFDEIKRIFIADPEYATNKAKTQMILNMQREQINGWQKLVEGMAPELASLNQEYHKLNSGLKMRQKLQAFKRYFFRR